MIYYLFAFDSTTSAIAAQKRLAGLDVIVMPTLREITAGCGLSLRLSPTQVEEAIGLLKSSSITGWQLYLVRVENKQFVCEPLG